MIDSAAGDAFMGKTVPEAKTILESMLHNHCQWHTERAPNPTKKCIQLKKKILYLIIDSILAYIAKQNRDPNKIMTRIPL
jgi:hypothetical protein